MLQLNELAECLPVGGITRTNKRGILDIANIVARFLGDGLGKAAVELARLHHQRIQRRLIPHDFGHRRQHASCGESCAGNGLGIEDSHIESLAE